jgi:hypothetical protein
VIPERLDNFSGAIAVSICRSCPVRAEWLAFAAEDNGRDAAGIYGGLTAEACKKLRRRLAVVPTASCGSASRPQ